MFAPAIVGGVGALAAGAVAVAGPLGLIVGAAAGARAAISLMGDEVAMTADGLVNLQDQFLAVSQVLTERLAPAWDGVGDAAMAMVSVLTDAMKGLPVTLQDVGNAVKSFANVMIGSLVFAARAITTAVNNIRPVVAEAFVGMANNVLSTVEQMVNGVIALLNKIPGVTIEAVNTGRFVNAYAGAGKEAAKAFSDTFAQSFGADYVGKITSGLDGLGDEVAKRARQIADARNAEAEFSGRDNAAKPGTGGRGQRVASSSDDAKSGRLNAYERAVRAINEEIAALRIEQETLGQSEEAITRAQTAQELLNAAKRAGLQITPELSAQVEQLAGAYAQAKSQADIMRESLEAFKSTANDALKGFINDLREGKSGTEALGNALNKIADKLIDMAVNQLVTSALGPIAGGAIGGSAGGGSLLSLFGFADGGVAAGGAPRALPRFASGGVSKSAAIFGEAGPEAAVPLPDGRRIPVDLRIANADQMPAQRAGGEVVVSVAAGPELMVTIDNRAEGVVARRAPEIVGASVKATRQNFRGMFQETQKRRG